MIFWCIQVFVFSKFIHVHIPSDITLIPKGISQDYECVASALLRRLNYLGLVSIPFLNQCWIAVAQNKTLKKLIAQAQLNSKLFATFRHWLHWNYIQFSVATWAGVINLFSSDCTIIHSLNDSLKKEIITMDTS